MSSILEGLIESSRDIPEVLDLVHLPFVSTTELPILDVVIFVGMLKIENDIRLECPHLGNEIRPWQDERCGCLCFALHDIPVSGGPTDSI
ncbi:Uncharacterized protein HZ326_17569 [Fusarium oxysporum f. sp. albedinis]|nr:Uncharacterized protein HZ326_17569 [Fusarium oxysporum f. sp. albedinis]